VGTAGTGVGHARDQTDSVRIAGVGHQEQGRACCCVERRCTTARGRASRPASDVCLHLGGSEGATAPLLPPEQLRVEGSTAPSRPSLPERAGAACAGRVQAGSGERSEAHVWASIAGSRREPGRQAGHPGPQVRPHYDPLQCPRDREPGNRGESDNKLPPNSRENHSKAGRVMGKSLKANGGRRGTRTLDPGIMRFRDLSLLASPGLARRSHNSFSSNAGSEITGYGRGNLDFFSVASDLRVTR
jgi:hypothetical protein